MLNKIRQSENQGKLVSVDLSAATDRLPVQFQADILEELGVPGEL